MFEAALFLKSLFEVQKCVHHKEAEARHEYRLQVLLQNPKSEHCQSCSSKILFVLEKEDRF